MHTADGACGDRDPDLSAALAAPTARRRRAAGGHGLRRDRTGQRCDPGPQRDDDTDVAPDRHDRTDANGRPRRSSTPTRPVVGSLSISKEITGSAAGQQGPIEITATCGASTTTFPIPAGATSAGPFTLTGLLAGTTCIVDEPVDGCHLDRRGLDDTDAADRRHDPGRQLRLGHHHEPIRARPASLTVTKTITGTGAAQHGPIAIVVDCGPENRSLIEVPAGGASPPPLVLAGLPTPATCNLSELLDGATDTVDVTTTGLGEVTLAPGDDTTVVVNDDYQPRPGELVLTKLISGDGAAQHGPIQLTATCSDGTDRNIRHPCRRGITLTRSPSRGSRLVPRAPSPNPSTAALPKSPCRPHRRCRSRPTPIPAGVTAQVVIMTSTRRNTGHLTVVKQISGPAADSRGDITLTVDCSDGTTASTTYTPTDPLDALDVGPLPFGTTCTVAEPNTGAVNGVTVDGPDFDPGPVVTINQPSQRRHRRQRLSVRPWHRRARQEHRRPSRRRSRNRPPALDLWRRDPRVRHPTRRSWAGHPVQRRSSGRHDMPGRRAERRRRLGRQRHHQLRPADQNRHGDRRRDHHAHRHQHLHTEPDRRPARRDDPHRPRRTPPRPRAVRRQL